MTSRLAPMLVAGLRACAAWPKRQSVYDPSNVTFTFNGVEIQGYPSEGFIGVQRGFQRVGDLDQAEREGRQRFTSTVGRPQKTGPSC